MSLPGATHSRVDLDGQSIDVWEVCLPDYCNLDPTLFLAPDELDRAARLRFKTDRERFYRSHIATRKVLGLATGMDPKTLRFRIGRYGKPKLVDDPGLNFNLSHSGHCALIAAHRGDPIGVDVEQIKPFDDLIGVARTVFCDSEIEALESARAEAKLPLFYRIWTRKEACIKAVGFGLQIEPKTFACGVEFVAGRERDVKIPSPATTVRTLATKDRDLAAAIALAKPD